MKKDPKKNLLDHSAAKVRLLEKYLQKYLAIIVNDGFTQKIFIFDLFCGEGLYENNAQGSPLVILRVVKDLFFINKAANKKMCPVEIIFNDEDVEKINKLETTVTNKKLFLKEIGRLKFNKLSYANILPQVQKFLKTLKKHKAFIFIDPYGYRDIRASHIKEILDTKKAEVLLFLPTQFMYRFDEKGTPQALIEIIKELVDYEKWVPSSSVFSFIEQFTMALREYLGKDSFVDTFTIQKDANTVFCLFFFSTHIRGFEKMLESKWELDEERGFTFEKTGNLFANQKFTEFEIKLLDYLKNFRSNSEIYFFTLSNGFLPKHVNEYLKKLESEEKIESESQKRKNAFYISYENYRDNPEKIKIKLVK